MVNKNSSSTNNTNEFIINLAKTLSGDDVADVIKLLLDKKVELTDEEIAKELNMKVNEVRKKLYALLENNFVVYRRVRDKDTGWYVYYWRVNLEEINEIILNRKRAVLNKLKQRLEYEKSGIAFICPQDDSTYTFEEALENDFKCPRCGTPLKEYDSQKIREFLEQKIRELSEEIEKEIKSGKGKNSSI